VQAYTIERKYGDGASYLTCKINLKFKISGSSLSRNLNVIVFAAQLRGPCQQLSQEDGEYEVVVG